jgi:DNA-binding GntR family transcriptional regulator
MAYQSEPLFVPVADPVSRTEIIVQTIREAILSGRLKSGEPLVERELAEQLGVSKTPIREALKILSKSGLVDALSFRGAAVRVVNVKLAETVYDARLVVEPEALRRSVPLQSPESISEAWALLTQAAEAGRMGDFLPLSLTNRRFHRILYSNCGNELLISFLDHLGDQVSLITIDCWRSNETWPSEAAEHDAILEAVEAGDTQLAVDRLAAHISASKARLLAVLSDR